MATAQRAIGPRIDFRIMADWGNANFHTIAGWILAHLRWQSAPRSNFWIKTGTGYGDNISALVSGEVDLTITTPYDVTPEWAIKGVHYFQGRGPAPFLRSLGNLPQDDRLLFAIRQDTGITSFADLRERKFPLKLASTARTSDNLCTWLAERVLALHGIKIEEWGGEWLGHDYPRISVAQVTQGKANAVMNEAIMVPQWRELVTKVPMRFLPYEESALQELEKTYGVRRGVLPAGRLTAPSDITCLEFANWGILVRDDMDEELAYRITSIMVEQRGELEARYRHMPPDISPLTYPIDPSAMCTGNGAPLHPGAERYYREHGFLR